MTLSNVLTFLQFPDYTHVCIREIGSTKGSFNYLGGGSSNKIVNRFGDREIVKSNIEDNKLIVYVSPR